MNQYFIFSLSIVAAMTFRAMSMDWNYYQQDQWPEAAPICGSGKQQSPVDLHFEIAEPSQELIDDPLQILGYDAYFCGNLSNNGHFAKYTHHDFSQGVPNPNKLPRIYQPTQMGPDVYLLDNLHFHWGAEDGTSYGGEHLVDFRPTQMEVHFVHYNSKYNTYDEALAAPDGLANLLFQYVAVPDDETYGMETDYKPIVDELPNISEKNTQVNNVCLSLKQLLPEGVLEGKTTYYRYFGALTGPGCNENIWWTVYRKTIRMPVSQLNAFRNGKMKDVNDMPLINLYRKELQPLNGRKVFINWVPKGAASKGATTSIILVMVSLLVTRLVA